MDEFLGCGKRCSFDDFRKQYADKVAVTQGRDIGSDAVLPDCKVDWARALEVQIKKATNGKASGPDGITVEALKSLGEQSLKVLGSIAQDSVADGPPWQWLGGRMACVPRAVGKPMNQSNIRGILCGNCVGKVF